MIIEPAGKPTKFAPTPKPEPIRAAPPMDGENISRSAKVAAAVMAIMVISSSPSER